VLEEKLYDYNMDSQSKMDLVFFEDAVKSINKITRILSQPRGNAMLLGVAGCGKQSLTRLASFMLEQKYFTLKLTQSFGPREFKDSLKEEMLSTGCEENKKTTFLN
jgi:dynein heavy chain